MSERYDEYNFVPIFWLEADDHDFNEVRSINVINQNNDVVNVAYDEEAEDEENRGSVGKLKIQESINNFFSELKENLRETEFTAPLFEKLKTFYSEGKTFKEAFKELMFWLFDEYGLVMFDPQDKKVKEILKPVFKKEITNFRAHTEKLVHTSATLEEFYHAQVKVRPVNLFYSTDEGRFLIEPVDNDFRLKRKRKKFSYQELIELIDKEPENFSPNVLLRPICQDYILPTAFYIGGPSEISYFAQVMPLYEFFNVAAPIIYPRSSATILEKNISAVIDKYDFNVNEIFIDKEMLKSKIVNEISETKLNDVFDKVENQIETAFDGLKEKLFELDKTISDGSVKYKQKIFHYLNELKDKATNAQNKKHETILRQLDKVSLALYPEESLQERELNYFYFANKYGVDFLKQIFEEVAINKFEHQIINL